MLCDFGFAIKKDDPDFGQFRTVGTQEYYPIEMLVKDSSGRSKGYDESVDIWCTGVLLYELIF